MSSLRNPAPLEYFGSLARKGVRSSTSLQSKQLSASDVWYHLYGLNGSRDEPAVRPDDQPRMYAKPRDGTYDYVACRLCRDHWHTWSCQNGQTQTIREHFEIHHFREWQESVVRNQLKGWESLALKPSRWPW
ncbi:hypothetical protein BD311DRAFT_772366 [Dichomitus squalens]|uniref:Uncharacterized protein n=1 Tax=Dichomitus squalens TaxID=114155 RepID=A0A4Q9M3E2_9APHY|nr:hypothetical protein BD311DRAFT_772366 [Dichomitus squalens]